MMSDKDDAVLESLALSQAALIRHQITGRAVDSIPKAIAIQKAQALVIEAARLVAKPREHLACELAALDEVKKG